MVWRIFIETQQQNIALIQNPILTEDLVAAVLEQRACSNSSVHGLSHWLRVERNGLFLAQETDVNLDMISYFALFHDSRRSSDGEDIDHGPRAAQLVEEMFDADGLSLSKDELELLCDACARHTKDVYSSNSVIQVCWDADRLDLPRVGEQPDPDLLNTTKARELVHSGNLHLLEGHLHHDFQELTSTRMQGTGSACR